MQRHPPPSSLSFNSLRKYLPLFSILLVVAASLLLYQPVLVWFGKKMVLTNSYLHLLTVLGVLGLAVYRLIKRDKVILYPPVFWHPALCIWGVATGLYLLNEVSIGFHTLSAVLFVVYVYGLSGHFISRQTWRAMLLPMLLLILVLPFEQYLDIYLGFPLRLFSAEWAASVLQFSSNTAATVESILIIDNKAAIVDLDCSGINSLWIGLIFYLLLTWIEQYRIGWRWLVVMGLFMGLLVMANVFRIVILVVLDLVWELPKLALLFHQSLGLLGFIVSSLLAWGILQVWGERYSVMPQGHLSVHSITPPSVAYSLWSTLAFLVVILTATAWYQPFEKQDIIQIKHQVHFKPTYQATAIALTPQETEFFVNNRAQTQKYAFNVKYQNKIITASVVLVWSKQWRSQHIPDNCYLAQGYTLQQKGVWRINSTNNAPTHRVRYLALQKKQAAQATKLLTGVYWFQSKQKTTPDFSSRVLGDLFHPNQEWVMVSILWEQPVNPKIISPFITQLYNELSYED